MEFELSLASPFYELIYTDQPFEIKEFSLNQPNIDMENDEILKNLNVVKKLKTQTIKLDNITNDSIEKFKKENTILRQIVNTMPPELRGHMILDVPSNNFNDFTIEKLDKFNELIYENRYLKEILRNIPCKYIDTDSI